MAKGKTKNNRAAKKDSWKKPKHGNVCGPEDVEVGATMEEVEDQERSRYGFRRMNKDSLASKLKQLDRLQRVRLERGVQRGRERFRNYVAPARESTEAEKRLRRKGGPETWKLRGAARPWVEVEATRLRCCQDETARAQGSRTTATGRLSSKAGASQRRICAAVKWRDAARSVARRTVA